MNQIKFEEIKLHPLSTGAEGFLYYHNHELYRSPIKKYIDLFEIIANINSKYIQPLFKTNLNLQYQNMLLPVYKHKIYDHTISIHETYPEKIKEFINVICDLNIELSKYNLIFKDIHYNNIFDTLDGIKIVDIGAIKKIDYENFSYSFVMVCYLIHAFLIKDYHDIHDRFCYQTMIDLNSPFVNFFQFKTNNDIWLDIKFELSKFNTSIQKGHWSEEYALNYDISSTEAIENTLKDKGKNFLQLIDEIKYNTVLDLACNKGYYSFLAARKAKSVLGLDIVEGCVKKAELEKKQKYNDLSVLFGVKDLNTILSNKYFELYRFSSDLVLALAIVHHIKSILTPMQFVNILDALSKKYILIEDIDQCTEYQKCFFDKSWSLLKRLNSSPEGRKLSLYVRK